MKKKICVFSGLFFIWICSFSLGIAAEKKPVLILADVSGSMQEKIEISKEYEKITKADVLKKLLMRISQKLPSPACETGIYRVRHITYSKPYYEEFMKIASYKSEEMTEKISDKFITDYPVFRRRTPIADMIRQLDEKELEQKKGEITIVLISDGKESFYDLESDEKTGNEKQNQPDKNDKIRGPLTEIKRLKEKYSNALILHTIFLDRKDNEKESEEEILLKNMAKLGEGKYFEGIKLLENEYLMTEFSSMLCEKEQIVKETPVLPAPEVIAKTSEPEVKEQEIRKDTDKDGVYDDDDKCIGTPLGAKVNQFGCWTLPGVLFDFDKWDIKQQFYSELDDAAVILKKNPDLKILVEGHTDNKGKLDYNYKLSEKRAISVKEYFIRKGIEKERLSVKGYSFTKPVTTNATSEGRASNRRVELTPVQ